MNWREGAAHDWALVATGILQWNWHKTLHNRGFRAAALYAPNDGVAAAATTASYVSGKLLVADLRCDTDVCSVRESTSRLFREGPPGVGLSRWQTEAWARSSGQFLISQCASANQEPQVPL